MNKLQLGHCVLLLLGLISLSYGQQQQNLDNLHSNEFYRYEDTSSPIQYLPNGDSEYAELSLDRPLHFYSRTYEKLFINTNGILTFNMEYPKYKNEPLPLELPSIAAFYSNVDTNNANASSSIYIFESQDPEQLNRANNLIHYAFPEKSNFRAQKLIVATWENVGYFNSKTDRLNTFQVILIVNDDDTFVQFIYPPNGLNWVRGEAVDDYYPDVRAQAGFVAEDKRFHILQGSGSDKARILSESSNVGVEGVWLYHVGPIEAGENVQAPTNPDTNAKPTNNHQTCSEVGPKICHMNAVCFDKWEGQICCVCQEGYYGNGLNCVKNDYPIRGRGSLSGEINNHVIDEHTRFHASVVMVDAMSDTIVYPVTPEVGSQLSLALPIVTTIGWLFAKPLNGSLNGFQLTGGQLLHVSKVRFDTGEVLVVNQTFEGLDYWDQLLVKIKLSGQVPYVSPGAKFHMADYVEEYKFVSSNEVSSIHAHTIEIPEENRVINFQVEQTIYFQHCQLDHDPDLTDTIVLQKVSEIGLDYFDRERSLRMRTFTEIGVDEDPNPCTDGTAVCEQNTVCVAYEDTYKCECPHGFTEDLDENSLQVCIDIDECELGTHVCDENASCSNNEGGFTCTCIEGFIGNGLRCLNNHTDNYTASTNFIVQHNLSSVGNDEFSQPTLDSNNYEECQLCSIDADCFDGHCQCRDGFSGDGYSCSPICGQGESLENGVCVTILTNHPDIEAECDLFGDCQCPDGFELLEYTHVCRYTEMNEIKSNELEPCEIDIYGNGYNCEVVVDSCSVRPEICDPHATCEPTEDPTHYECQCNAGYHGDGYVCHEDQNCLNAPHMCDMNAKCSSTSNGLICVCNPGFYGNGSVCFQHEQHESNFLVVSQGLAIVRVPLDGKNMSVISVAALAIAVDKDCIEGRIYWGDIAVKKIISSKYDGTDLREFITEDIESPEGIAIDAHSRRLYWTDTVKNTVEVASLDNPSLRTVLFNTSLENPRGIAVDPLREKLYFADWNRDAPEIEMSNLDGSGREILLASGKVKLPNSLVVLQRTGEVCYADAGTKKVECIEVFSKSLRTICNDVVHPFALTFTSGTFYWTDWETLMLESVDTNGNRRGTMKPLLSKNFKMYGITAIENSCPQLESPCKSNGGCADSRLCLVNRKEPSGKSCKCTNLSNMC